MRRIVEEPDILPGSHFSFRGPRVANSANNAVLLFGLRTLLRSRQHRVILSIYLGTGFAVMLVLLRPAVGNEGTVVAWLAVSILMLCIVVVAMRIVFSMPIALKANWIFRLAALQPVATYSKAMRRTFLLLAVVPVWLAFAALFFSSCLGDSQPPTWSRSFYSDRWSPIYARIAFIKFPSPALTSPAG